MACQDFELLDPDKIKENLNTTRIGRKVLVYNRTSSTNDIARRYTEDKYNDGLAIFAEEQTAGRGRAGNKWHSKRSDSILCSILLIDNKIDTELLSLTCAVAVADAIGKPVGSQLKIKWPNDIILNGRKMAGILLEAHPNNDRNTCIAGIGINCHQQKIDFPDELQLIATSLDIESHSVVDRTRLAKRLLSSFDHWLERAYRNKKEVTDQWRQLSSLLGNRVTLIFNGKKFTGNCIGIDPEKGLILQLDSGGIRMFDAAHTTIAK
jgi:BirA family biotin operon repressor/biotin-[acetyl-CoA-carboxylase] ligase